jgi:hypothetical protein
VHAKIHPLRKNGSSTHIVDSYPFVSMLASVEGGMLEAMEEET